MPPSTTGTRSLRPAAQLQRWLPIVMGRTNMFFRIAGIMAIMLGAAEAFRCLLLRSPLGSNNHRMKMVSSTTQADTPAVAFEDLAESKNAKFDWNKQWYPVLSLKHTDEGRAQPVQLLGKDLVVWRNKEGRWTCFDERCPHRAAPLTEGRVEKDGTLLCAYHAWRFDADGKCVKIPQSNSGGTHEARPKACAKVHPTQVAQNIIWVWGDNGPDAALESALSSPPLFELPPGKKAIFGAISQRDLPYGWDYFMENVVDPSHVQVSHHGIMGSRYDAKPVPAELVEGSMNEKGFSIAAESSVSGLGIDITSFIAPFLVKIGPEKIEDKAYQLMLYNIPTRPGWSRMVSYQVSIVPDGSNAKAEQLIATPGGLGPDRLPDWLQHVFGHKFIAQDLVFLHHQERMLAASGISNSNYGGAVYLPTSADVGVVNLKKWITKYAGGGPAWVAGCDRTTPPRELKRDVLLDVYEQHTKNCTACLGALKRVKQLLTAANTSAVASLSWAVLRAARVSGMSISARALSGIAVRAMLPGLAITFASLAAIKVLDNLREAFYTSPYHHQDYD